MRERESRRRRREEEGTEREKGRESGAAHPPAPTRHVVCSIPASEVFKSGGLRARLLGLCVYRQTTSFRKRQAERGSESESETEQAREQHRERERERHAQAAAREEHWGEILAENNRIKLLKRRTEEREGKRREGSDTECTYGRAALGTRAAAEELQRARERRGEERKERRREQRETREHRQLGQGEKHTLNRTEQQQNQSGQNQADRGIQKITQKESRIRRGEERALEQRLGEGVQGVPGPVRCVAVACPSVPAVTASP